MWEAWRLVGEGMYGVLGIVEVLEEGVSQRYTWHYQDMLDW